MQQIDGLWSKPQLVPFSAGKYDWDFMLAPDSKTVFVASARPLRQGDIYMSPKQNGKYTRVVNLNAPINSMHHEVDPYIAPDESYLIFCSDRPGGFGKADIYVSFRRENGSWTPPVNMGSKVNTPYQEYIPYVTPDGKYFFFTTNKSGNRDIYWVDAKIIEKFKPDDLK